MIKRVIFDLDNTIIDWKDEYLNVVIDIVNNMNLGYDLDKVKQIDKVFSDYEDYKVNLEPEKFIKFINDGCNTNLPVEFIYKVIEGQGKCAEKLSEEKIELFKYLSNKYELMILSNWFTKTQEERLKIAGIYQYFKYISGGDKHSLKPSIHAFDEVLNGIMPNEAVMIGDSISKDIEPAISLGMNAILISSKNIRKDIRYKRISDLNELKNIL